MHLLPPRTDPSYSQVGDIKAVRGTATLNAKPVQFLFRRASLLGAALSTRSVFVALLEYPQVRLSYCGLPACFSSHNSCLQTASCSMAEATFGELPLAASIPMQRTKNSESAALALCGLLGV